MNRQDQCACISIEYVAFDEKNSFLLLFFCLFFLI